MKDRKGIIQSLGKCRIFEGLAFEDLEKISPFFEQLELRNGEYVFMEGDPSDWLYIVTDKRVKIVKHTQSGKEVLLEIKSPGDMFCCAAVLDNRPYPETAQAKGKASILRISRKNFLGIVSAYPFLKAGIAQYLNDKLIDAYEMLKNLSSEIAERRIATVLLKLSEKAGSDGGEYRTIDFSFTRQEIADMVGTTLETAIRTMSKFEKLGMIKSTRRNIMIKEAALEKLLAG